MLDIRAGSGTDTLIASRIVEPLNGDAERTSLPEASVDVVTSNGALNLVPQNHRAFAEIFRVLRPGGRVQIADIFVARPFRLPAAATRCSGPAAFVGASVDSRLPSSRAVEIGHPQVATRSE